MESFKEIVSSKQNRTDVHMNSKKLYHDAQSLLSLKVERVSELKGGNR